ncbi:MAG: hypothetical protein ACFBRM_13710 [Pikeienuella sp.]
MTVEVQVTLTNRNHLVTFDYIFRSVTEPRELPVQLFAPDEPGSYPLVVYNHGQWGQISATGGAHPRAIAEAGFGVAAPTHLDSTDNPFAITRQFPFEPETTLHLVADIHGIVAQAEILAGALPGYDIDASRPVIAGHSHGARTALLVAGAEPSLPEFSLAPGNPFGLGSIALPDMAGIFAQSAEARDGLAVAAGTDAWVLG